MWYQLIHSVIREVLTWVFTECLVSLFTPPAPQGCGGGLLRLRPRCPLHACHLRLPARRFPVQTCAWKKGATLSASRDDRSLLGQRVGGGRGPRGVLAEPDAARRGGVEDGRRMITACCARALPRWMSRRGM